MPRRLPLLLAVLGVVGLLLTAVLLLSPLPGAGAVGTALRPAHPDAHVTRGLQILSEEQYQRVHGQSAVVSRRRRRATVTGSTGTALLLAASVLLVKRSRHSR